MVRTTFSMTEGDLKVTLRVDKEQTIVSVLFDNELIDQYTTKRVKDANSYMRLLIESARAVMKDALNVPDLSPIDYA